jgi:hypothetical protein
MEGMAPHNIPPPPKKKSAENIIATVFWDEVVTIFVSLLPMDATTDCDHSTEPLRSPNACFCRIRSAREMSDTRFSHDIKPHSNVSTTETITTSERTVFPYAPYCPDFVPPYINVTSFERQPARTPLRGWGRAVAAAKGGQLLVGGNVCIFFKGGRRLLAHMEIILENKRAFSKLQWISMKLPNV